MYNKKIAGALLASTILIGSMVPSHAYYSKTNYSETFEIQPNQSAFLIPLQGANKDTQSQFGSESYYQENKVAAKRIEVPHTKLPNSGYTSDYYVPSAKLIIVDRTPYNQEWTDDAGTGTSSKKEGFHFESADSINIETDITIAASVSEANAAKFLYWFGTVNQRNPIPYDPSAQYQTDAYYSAQYASVAYGKSLAEVMQTLVRGEVQRALAKGFSQYVLTDVLAKKAEIMDAVAKETTDWCTQRGITLDYIGYANGLNFDPKVQEAINNVFIEQKKADAVATQKNVLTLRQTIANIKLTEKLGDVMMKWNGALPSIPSFLAWPSNIFDNLMNWITPSTISTKKVG